MKLRLERLEKEVQSNRAPTQPSRTGTQVQPPAGKHQPSSHESSLESLDTEHLQYRKSLSHAAPASPTSDERMAFSDSRRALSQEPWCLDEPFSEPLNLQTNECLELENIFHDPELQPQLTGGYHDNLTVPTSPCHMKGPDPKSQESTDQLSTQASFCGKSVLHLAVETGSLSMTNLILAQGVPVNTADDTGQRPLHVVAARGFGRLAELLLEHGAEVAVADAAGRSPLHLRSASGRLCVMKLLMVEAADIDARDIGGATALHHAVANGHEEAARLLLSNGASASITR